PWARRGSADCTARAGRGCRDTCGGWRRQDSVCYTRLMGTPILTGELSAFALPDILNLLNTNRKTGSLRCAQGDVWKAIEWQEGAIVFARSSRNEDRFGSYLVSRRKLAPAQL